MEFRYKTKKGEVIFSSGPLSRNELRHFELDIPLGGLFSASAGALHNVSASITVSIMRVVSEKASLTMLQTAIADELKAALGAVGKGSEPKPPAIGWWILAVICPRDELEFVLGDMEEGFVRYALQRGQGAAHWWYWWQMVRTATHFILRVLDKARSAINIFKAAG